MEHFDAQEHGGGAPSNSAPSHNRSTRSAAPENDGLCASPGVLRAVRKRLEEPPAAVRPSANTQHGGPPPFRSQADKTTPLLDPDGAADHSPRMPETVVPLRIRVSPGPEDGGHATYSIHLQMPHGKSWSIARRYSEFIALKHELEGLHAKAPALSAAAQAFPPKHFIRGSTNQVVVNERLAALPQWLCGISQDPFLSTQVS